MERKRQNFGANSAILLRLSKQDGTDYVQPGNL
jgi:hypothetical protein